MLKSIVPKEFEGDAGSSDVTPEKIRKLSQRLMLEKAREQEQEQRRAEYVRIVSALGQGTIELKDQSVEIKDDQKAVKAAVMKDGDALRYASERLRSILDIVFLAYNNKPESVRFADPSLMLGIVERDPDTLPYMTEGAMVHILIEDRLCMGRMSARSVERLVANNPKVLLKASRGNVLVLTGKSWRVLKFVLSQYKSDKEIVLAALKQDIRAMNYVVKTNKAKGEEETEGEEEKKDLYEDEEVLGVISDGLRNDGDLLEKLPQELQNKKEFVLVAMEDKKDALMHGSNKVILEVAEAEPQRLCELTKDALQEIVSRTKGGILEFLLPTYNNYFEFVKGILRDEGLWFEFVPNKDEVLKYCPLEVVKAEVAKNPRKILVASDGHKRALIEKDPDLLGVDNSLLRFASLLKQYELISEGPDRMVHLEVEDKVKLVETYPGSLKYLEQSEQFEVIEKDEKLLMLMQTENQLQYFLGHPQAKLENANVKKVLARVGRKLSELVKFPDQIQLQIVKERRAWLKSTSGRTQVEFLKLHHEMGFGTYVLKEVVAHVCKYPVEIQSLSDSVVEQILEKKPMLLEHASQEQQDNRSLVFSAASNGNGEEIRFGSENSKLLIINTIPDYLKFLDEEEQSDLLQKLRVNIQVECLKNDPKLYKYSSREEVVNYLCEEPSELQFFPPDILIPVLAQKPLLLEHITEEHKQNERVVSIAVHKDSNVLVFVPKDFRYKFLRTHQELFKQQSLENQLLCLKEDHRLFEGCSDKEVLNHFAKHLSQLKDYSDEMACLFMAEKGSGEYLRHASKNQRDNYVFVKFAINFTPTVLQHASVGAQKQCIVEQGNGYLQYTSLEAAKLIVREDGTKLEYVAESHKIDEALICIAVSKNREAIQYGRGFNTLANIVAQFPDATPHLPEQFRHDVGFYKKVLQADPEFRNTLLKIVLEKDGLDQEMVRAVNKAAGVDVSSGEDHTNILD